MKCFFYYSCSCSSIHYPFIISFRVHIKLSERASISSGRDSGLKSMEVLGMMTLKINEGGYGRINLSIANNEDRTVQFQVLCSYNMTRLGLQPVLFDKLI